MKLAVDACDECYPAASSSFHTAYSSSLVGAPLFDCNGLIIMIDHCLCIAVRSFTAIQAAA